MLNKLLELFFQYGSPFFCGAFLGVVFAGFNLPIPAPNKIEGILGIIGIFVGYLLFGYISGLKK